MPGEGYEDAQAFEKEGEITRREKRKTPDVDQQKEDKKKTEEHESRKEY